VLEEEGNAIGWIFRQFGSGQEDDKRIQSRVRDKEQEHPADCLEQAGDSFTPDTDQEERVLDFALDAGRLVRRHGVQ